MKKISIIILAIFLTSCASSNLSGSSYSRSDARNPQVIMFGTILDLRNVQIEGGQELLGTGTGAVLGGILGSMAGGGKNKDKISKVGVTSGAVLGGIAGSYITDRLTRVQGVEITVKHDNKEIKAYVQQVDPNETLHVGDRVRISYLNGNYRVTASR